MEDDELSRNNAIREIERFALVPNHFMKETDLNVMVHGVMTGELNHAWMGSCPDAIEGFASRDAGCLACQVIMSFEAQVIP